MAKQYIDVLIDGKVYSLGGSETEGYVQQIATYLNGKIFQLKAQPGFLKMPEDYQSIMTYLNLADDYFKEKESAKALASDKESMEKETYRLKHEMVSTQMKLESLRNERTVSEEELETAKKAAKEAAEQAEAAKNEVQAQIERVKKEAQEQIEAVKKTAQEQVESARKEAQEQIERAKREVQERVESKRKKQLRIALPGRSRQPGSRQKLQRKRHWNRLRMQRRKQTISVEKQRFGNRRQKISVWRSSHPRVKSLLCRTSWRFSNNSLKKQDRRRQLCRRKNRSWKHV
ncbi:MAG: cell division protein ZapA [Clostridium fessum]